MGPSRLIVLIVALAAVLRLYPIWFGLPHLYARPDEEVATSKALGILLRGDFNPHFFHWPSLTFYLFAALYGVARVVRSALGLDPALSGAHQLLIARACVACAGAATVYVLFRIGRRVAGETAGLIAALLLAVAVLHVRDSHFAMTDVLMTFFVTMSLALVLRGMDAGAGSLRWCAVAGFAGGLAASTKYSAAAVIAAMGATQLVLWSRGWRAIVSPGSWRPSVVFVTIFVAGFLLATPYAVLDFQAFDAGFRFNMEHLSEGHGIDLGLGWIYHATNTLPYGVGFATFAAALLGLVPLVRYYPRHAFVLLTFFACFYLAIGNGRTVFFRYILPLVPLVCLFAAVGVRHVGEWIAPRVRLSPPASVLTLAMLVAAPSLVNSVWFDVVLARTDTRVIARAWLAPRLTPDSTLYDAGGKYATLDLSGWKFHPWYFDTATGSFGHPRGETPHWLVLPDSPVPVYTPVPADVRTLAARDYVLVKEVRGARTRPRSAMYDQQDAFFMPVSGFSTLERPGPTIRIYRRRDLR